MKLETNAIETNRGGTTSTLGPYTTKSKKEKHKEPKDKVKKVLQSTVVKKVLQSTTIRGRITEKWWLDRFWEGSL